MQAKMVELLLYNPSEKGRDSGFFAGQLENNIN